MSKFEFTKALSLAIEILAKIGNIMEFSRGDFAFLTVNDIYAANLYKNEWDLKDFLTTIIKGRKEIWELNSQIELPEVILDENSFSFIKLEQAKPNYISDKIISGEIINIENNKNADVSGKIVLIDKADPGYDWIFTKNIKGLVTKYGGVASHMAIRCSEFGLPAAIGVGEQIYSKVSHFKTAIINCKTGKIENGEKEICLV